MALRRHIALASVHRLFENPDTTIITINIETGSMEIIFEKP
jgi:hypothetical protein